MGKAKPSEGDVGHNIVAYTGPIKHQRKIWVIITAIIALIIVASLVFYFTRNSKGKVILANACSTKSAQHVLEETAPILNSVNIAKLPLLVTKIQKIPNYEDDPSCLYPIVMYYIDTSNAKESNIYLNKFISVYNPKYELSTYLGPVYSVKVLKTDVAALQQNAKNDQKGITFPGEQ